MEISYSQSHAQRVLRQRNMFAAATAGLALVSVFALVAASGRDREVVLQPVHSRALTISSAGVSREYLELMKRDVRDGLKQIGAGGIQPAPLTWSDDAG